MNTNRVFRASIILLVLSYLLVSGCNNKTTLTIDQAATEAYHQEYIKECLRVLNQFKDRVHYKLTSTLSSEYQPVAIKKAVADGLVTWEELGLADSDELDKIYLKYKVRQFKYFSNRLRKGKCYEENIDRVTRHLRQAVADGLVTWEELGFANSEQLSESIPNSTDNDS